MANDKVAVVVPARVAEVLSAYKVVINKGAFDGVRSGQTYQFYANGPDIFDPETNEILGQLELLRGTGRVIHVQERMSIVYTTSRRPYTISTQNNLLAALGNITTRSEDEPIAFDSISVGDFARPI